MERCCDLVRGLSEIQPQGELPCAIAAVFRRLHALNDAERRRGDVGGWRRKVRMIQQVCKCALKPQAHALGDLEVFRQAGGDCCCPGSLENSHPAVPHWAGRNWIESREIEHAAS